MSNETIADIILDESKIEQIFLYETYNSKIFQFTNYRLATINDWFQWPIHLRDKLAGKLSITDQKFAQLKKSYIKRLNEIFSSNQISNIDIDKAKNVVSNHLKTLNITMRKNPEDAKVSWIFNDLVFKETTFKFGVYAEGFRTDVVYRGYGGTTPLLNPIGFKCPWEFVENCFRESRVPGYDLVVIDNCPEFSAIADRNAETDRNYIIVENYMGRALLQYENFINLHVFDKKYWEGDKLASYKHTALSRLLNEIL